jgi:multidrug efflux pump subunit AcrB
MIAQLLYHRPRIMILLISVILIAGCVSFVGMPRLEDPVLGRRVGVISTVYPGIDAAQMETRVTIPIEQQLESISQIKQVRSNSRAGISNIVIELADEVYDVAAIWSRVREAATTTPGLQELPQTATPPDLDVFPLKAQAIILAVKPKTNEPGSGTERLPATTLARIAQQLKAKLLNVAGTQSAEVFGDSGEELLVEIDAATLASLELPVKKIADQIADSLAAQPSGSIENSDTTLLLDLVDNTPPQQSLANTPIVVRTGEPSTRLADIATITQQTVAPASELAIVDGEEAIFVAAMMDDQLRIDQWTSRIDAVLDRFRQQYDDAIDIEILFSQQDHVARRMSSLLTNLGIGTLAVMVIVLLLMNFRSMLVVSLALPMSALMVVAGLRVLEIPIHQMSVTGLIVALGLLIDNAIVIVEEMRIRLREGLSPVEAIRESVGQLALPLLGSTVTTALAFLPIATLPGPAGEFVGTIAVSVILAITASFVLSMTIIPALAAWLQQLGRSANSPQSANDGFAIGWLTNLYEWSLRLVLRFPPLGWVTAAALPVAGFFIASQLPIQFFPASDRAQIQIEIETPAGSTIAATEQAVQQVRATVLADPRVVRQSWMIGRSAPTFYYNVVPRRRGTRFYAQAFVDVLPSAAQSATLVRDLQTALGQQSINARVIVRQLEQGPPFDAPVEVRVVGPNRGQLKRIGAKLRSILAETPDVIATRSDLESSLPMVSMQPDINAIANAGLNERQLAGLVYSTVEGTAAGRVFDAGQEIPVRVRMSFAGRPKLETIGAIPLPTMEPATNGPPRPGQTVLGNVVDFELTGQSAGIIRVNGERVNEVKAYITAGVLPSVVLDRFRRRLSNTTLDLPAGYRLEIGGENEQRSNAIDRLIGNSIFLFGLMVLTLVAAFQSFRCALIVMMVAALSVGPGLLALWLTGFPLGFMAIVGMMGLAGVAINDSIVVLAAIRSACQSKAVGNDQPHAKLTIAEIATVVSGCTRHILATTLTTVVGFSPLIINGGAFWPPLAITIAGGVAGATILALYFAPTMYRSLCGCETAN